ncbi:MAG: arginine--tRNA ligase [Candidatus Dasytiphilus stammeri]
MNLKKLISNRIHKAMITSGITYKQCKIKVSQSLKDQFGHYQVNGIFAIAKDLKIQPQKLANQIIRNLKISDIASQVSIVNSGYINIYIDRIWMAHQLNTILILPNLGIEKVKPKIVVIDYSAPNVAKEMHVGHLRSTIIGDASARTLTLLGYNVIRANHIGDWGMQFGMLIAILDQYGSNHYHNLSLKDLEELYRQAKYKYETDKNFAETARNNVVQLQQGDAHCLKLWKRIVDLSMRHNQVLYQRLNVSLTSKDIMGESIYNEMLPIIVADLKEKGIAVEDKGAIVVFLDEFKNKQGNPMGVIIQKKDGGYLYTTTDIACAKYRYETLHADRIIYYIDSRQHQHLKQVWTIVRKAGYVPESISLEHHMFGMMLGKDHKPFKTRTGNNIKLADILDEAIARAKNILSSKKPSLSSEEQQRLANIIGIGALKYADLSKNRMTDYVFDWDQMLSFDGNTALYIQYAYTRAMSIFRRSAINESNLIHTIKINNDCETRLAIRLLQFHETIVQVANNGTPHLMCAYLYNLASLFSMFYENYSILSISNEKIQQSRLKLVLLTAKILKQGLEILGIQTVEHM